MSQNVWSSINPTTTSGTALSIYLNDFKDAIMSGLSGSSRPAQTTAGGGWIDTTNAGSPNFYWSYKVYTGTVDVEIFRVNLSTNTASIAGADSTFDITRYSADTVGPILRMIKRRVATFGQVLPGDIVGEIRAIGRTNTSTDPIVANLKVVATDTMTSSASGAYVSLEVTPTGTASPVEIMRIIDGLIGVGTITPDTKLHVESSTGIKSAYNADSVNGAKITTDKGRVSGDKASDSGDVISQWDMRTTDDLAAKSTAGQIVVTATQDHTAAAQGVKMEIKTSDDGAAIPSVGVTLGSKVEVNKTAKVNALELVNQNIATAATIAQLSATKSLVEFTGATGTSVQGLNSGHAAKVVAIHNRSTADVTLKHQDAGATANDRMKLPAGADIIIRPERMVELFYCTTDSRWKLISGTGEPLAMTSTVRDALTAPYTGLVIFNTTTTGYEFYNGTAWTNIGSGTLGNNVYIQGRNFANSGNVNLVKIDTSDRAVIGGYSFPVTGGNDDDLLYTDKDKNLGFVRRNNKRTMYAIKNQAAATVFNGGFAASPTLTATASSVEDSTGIWLRHATTTVSQNPSGVVSTTFTGVQPRWLPEYSIRMRIGAGPNDESFTHGYVGFFSASPDAAGLVADGTATPATAFAAFCWVNPTTGGTGRYEYVAVTSNGTAGGANYTKTNTGIYSGPIDHVIRIVWVSTSSVKFYIDGVLVATHTTTLPTSSQALGWGARIVTDSNLGTVLSRVIDWQNLEVRHV